MAFFNGVLPSQGLMARYPSRAQVFRPGREPIAPIEPSIPASQGKVSWLEEAMRRIQAPNVSRPRLPVVPMDQRRQRPWQGGVGFGEMARRAPMVGPRPSEIKIGEAMPFEYGDYRDYIKY